MYTYVINITEYIYIYKDTNLINWVRKFLMLALMVSFQTCNKKDENIDQVNGLNTLLFKEVLATAWCC